MSDPERTERPRVDHGQDERHPQGWRVNPSPDGRGTPPVGRPAVAWRFMLFVALIVVMNMLLIASLGRRPVERLSIPYSPVFLEQVRAGNVVSIASKGATVQGEFRRAVRHPRGDRTAGESYPGRVFLGLVLLGFGGVLLLSPPTRSRATPATTSARRC